MGAVRKTNFDKGVQANEYGSFSSFRFDADCFSDYDHKANKREKADYRPLFVAVDPDFSCGITYGRKGAWYLTPPLVDFNFTEVHFTVGSLGRAKFDEEMDRLLFKAESSIPSEVLPDLPCMKNTPDVPAWHDFEFAVWNAAEEIRQLVFDSKKTFHKDQTDRILSICLNKRAKRGRQSFVMLLGKTKYCDYAGALVPLLEDDDVNGHVIETLYKMRARGYAALISPFLTHKQTWIRNAAKKYIRRFAESNLNL